MKLVRIRIGWYEYAFINPDFVTHVTEEHHRAQVHLVFGEVVECFYPRERVVEDLKQGEERGMMRAEAPGGSRLRGVEIPGKSGRIHNSLC
jgi:hypothetical protein